MIEMLNIQIAALKKEKRGQHIAQIREQFKKFIENYPSPLCYSFRTSFIDSTGLEDGKKEKPHQNRNQTNPMADFG